MEEQIILDKQSFKALAVDTRVTILKTLGQRRHTQSELAATLELSVPTIKEHLDALVKADLVARQDDGHKWVYYALTKKGKAVVNPEEKKFWIVLSVFILTIVGGFAGFIRDRFSGLYNPQLASVSAEMKAAPAMLAGPAPTAAATDAARAAPLAATPQAPVPWAWVILVAFIALELGLVLYFWYRMQKQKKLLGAHLSKNARI